MKKFAAVLLVICMVFALSISAFAYESIELPRETTLFICGMQKGTPASWNPIAKNQNNPLVFGESEFGARETMFETLYMFNILNGSAEPLLAEGQPQYSKDGLVITVMMNSLAKWNDATDVTAADVEKTWQMSQLLKNDIYEEYEDCIESVVAAADDTLVITLKAGADAEKAEKYLTNARVCQKAWLEALEERCGGNVDSMLRDQGIDVTWSGPYTRYYWDEEIVALVRDDNYWAGEEEARNALPVPKYIAHYVGATAAEGFSEDVANTNVPEELVPDEDGKIIFSDGIEDLNLTMFSVMPKSIQCFNEEQWSNFTKTEDGALLPPGNCLDGVCINALYSIESKS